MMVSNRSPIIKAKPGTLTEKSPKNSNGTMKTKSDPKLEKSTPMQKEVETNYVPDVQSFYDCFINEAPYIPGNLNFYFNSVQSIYHFF